MKKNKYGMPTPNNRAEYEHNISMTIEMAKQNIENGEFDIHYEFETKHEMKKLKSTPNGRLDLLSVDNNLRLKSNLLYWVELT